jgi:hypothetical protein
MRSTGEIYGAGGIVRSAWTAPSLLVRDGLTFSHLDVGAVRAVQLCMPHDISSRHSPRACALDLTRLLLLATFAFMGTTAGASPITATLDGCVKVDDLRLADAEWFAHGTFQAVAFDDWQAGCDTTILTPVHDVYVFDEDRTLDTLTARLNLAVLPTCGRRQYDLHYYLEEGVLDPFGLKSLVIDTGVDCPVVCLVDCGNGHRVPEPGVFTLVALGAATLYRRRAGRSQSKTRRP